MFGFDSHPRSRIRRSNPIYDQKNSDQTFKTLDTGLVDRSNYNSGGRPGGRIRDAERQSG